MEIHDQIAFLKSLIHSYGTPVQPGVCGGERQGKEIYPLHTFLPLLIKTDPCIVVGSHKGGGDRQREDHLFHLCTWKNVNNFRFIRILLQYLKSLYR